jgi:hypothetical protein
VIELVSIFSTGDANTINPPFCAEDVDKSQQKPYHVHVGPDRVYWGAYFDFKNTD